MKVVLIEKVKSLGNVGEIVNVSEGFARNYLIPNKMALAATEGNKLFIEDQQRRLQKKIQDQKDHALALKKKIEGLTLEFVKRVGGNGKLFGTVTNTELAKELEDRQIEVERRSIVIENPIKSLGEFDVKVKLFTDVEAKFKVKVVLDPKQAEEMKKQQELALKAKKEREAQAAEDAKKEKEAAEAAPVEE